MIETWSDPPPMEPGAPEPAVFHHRGEVWVAYRCANPDFPGWDRGAPLAHYGFDEYCAVLHFEGVVDVRFGFPSEDRLHEHPLYGAGLERYAFHRATQSPLLATFARRDLRHWIVTFHDETLEVVGRQAAVARAREAGPTPAHALLRAVDLS